MKISGIYAIICLENGKYYVGSSKNIKRRKTSHFYALKNNCHDNNHLQRAYNLYGLKSFIFMIIDEIPEQDLLKIEQKYLNLVRMEPKISFNLLFNARGGGIIKPKKEKVPNANLLNRKRYVRKNITFIPKYTKMSQSKLKEKNSFFGKHHSLESIKKIKEKCGQKINQINPSNRQIIKTWNSITEIKDYLNQKSRGSIYRALYKIQPSYKGFIWEYA